MYQIIAAVVIATIFTGPSYAVDAVAWIKDGDSSMLPMKLRNIQLIHLDGSVDESVIILGFDGSKLSIPLASLDGIYTRGNNYVVKTKIGNEHILPKLQGMAPQFVGDNYIGGSTSFSAQYMSYITFR